VCADHTEKHKPEPEPLLKYMELTGAKPDEVLYIGDSKYDEMCAHAAGVDFALATWGATDLTLPAEWKPAEPMEIANIVK
ncbi:MAG: HAD hydrolase-like protein, partial [Clostridia bacterium]|nr:HAD hydrolase-like protein [Clostridia bacterium]